MADIIEARVKQKVDTEARWASNTLPLLDGEIAFVKREDGMPVNLKIGDGGKTFSELPYFIEYEQAEFIPVAGNSLPVPVRDTGYTIVGSGTYTQSGGSDVIVPENTLGILYYSDEIWSLETAVSLPVAAAFNFKGNVPNYASLPSSGNVQNDAWYNLDDKLLYVYNGSQFPSSGNGINLGNSNGDTTQIHETVSLSYSRNTITINVKRKSDNVILLTLKFLTTNTSATEVLMNINNVDLSVISTNGFQIQSRRYSHNSAENEVSSSTSTMTVANGNTNNYGVLAITSPITTMSNNMMAYGDNYNPFLTINMDGSRIESAYNSWVINIGVGLDKMHKDDMYLELVRGSN